MNILEFASLFKMTADEMCEFTGYSRKELSELISKSTARDTKQYDTYHNLKNRAVDMRLAEMNAADRDYEERMAAAEKVFGFKKLKLPAFEDK